MLDKYSAFVLGLLVGMIGGLLMAAYSDGKLGPNSSMATIEVAATEDEEPQVFYTVPTAGEFFDYIYNEGGHQNIDFYSYFSRYAQVDAEVGTGYKNNCHRMCIFKLDGANCLIYQPNNISVGGAKPVAEITIYSPDGHTKWKTNLPNNYDGPIIDDQKMGISLSKKQLEALSTWLKLDGEYPVDYCPFSGLGLPHTISTTVYDSESKSSITYGDVTHED